MTTDKAQLEVILRGDISQFQRAMRTGAREVKGFETAVGGSSRTVLELGQSATSSFLGVTAAATAGIAAAAGLAYSFKSLSDAASALQETQNKVGVVFGTSADEIRTWGETSATAMGMSTQKALDGAATLANFATSLGLAGPEAAKMSTSVVQLAADLASFNDASPEETLLALRSGLSGEAEPLRRFGVALSAAAVEAKAMELGLARTKSEISEGAKVAARYAIIMDQTKTAQGDFARTSDGLANSQRTLQGNLENVRAKLGAGLTPALEEATGKLNAFLESAEGKETVDTLADSVANLADVMGLVTSAAIEGSRHVPTFLKLLGVPVPNVSRPEPFAAMTDAEAGVLPRSQWPRRPELEPSGKFVLTNRGDISMEDFAKTLDGIFATPAKSSELLSKAMGGSSTAADNLSSRFDAAAENLRAVSEAERIMREAENKAREDTIKALQDEVKARQQAGISYINSLNQQGVTKYAPGVFETIAGAFGLNVPKDTPPSGGGVDIVVP